ncbi:hypothetical protein B4084_5040 [Bacillus cereus]|nr:hypothetical protein B4084_5040 [Bacillus cereus]
MLAMENRSVNIFFICVFKILNGFIIDMWDEMHDIDYE